MVQKACMYTKNNRPHGNTTLGLEEKLAKRIKKTAVQPSIEPRSNTAWQHHLNNGGLEEGGTGAGRESLFGHMCCSHVSTFSFHFFWRYSVMRVHFCFTCFHGFSLRLLCFHSCFFVVFSRFLQKTKRIFRLCPAPRKNEKRENNK